MFTFHSYICKSGIDIFPIKQKSRTSISIVNMMQIGQPKNWLSIPDCDKTSPSIVQIYNIWELTGIVQLQLAGLFDSEKQKVFKIFLICSLYINGYLNEICHRTASKSRLALIMKRLSRSRLYGPVFGLTWKG